MEKKKRIDLIDYLKAISCFLVITTHYDWVDKHGFQFTGFINMAVPIFMILTGYNFAMSYKKKTDGSFRQLYSWRMIGPRLNRFLVPFVLILFVEWALKMLIGAKIDYSLLLLRGGYGPGSYYVPLLIELLVIFPFIYKLVDRFKAAGVAIVGVINFLYEVGIVVFHISKPLYRLLVGRYMLLVALGCYLFIYGYKTIKNWVLGAMFVVGMLFQIVILHMKVNVGLFPHWKPTTMFISFYIFPIVVVLFKLFAGKSIPGKFGDFLSLAGKASYHIFLVQMVYYHFHMGRDIMDMAWPIAVPFNIVITVAAGIVFFLLEERVRKIFVRR